MATRTSAGDSAQTTAPPASATSRVTTSMWTLAEGWNGATWVLQATPNPVGALASSLNGAACPSSTVCEAVGDYDNSSGIQVTLVEAWSS